ncbi:MAG: PEP-CTERM sorting domain-containing protein [Acidobacteria bacterium]|nr:PEP-CTERM sorting domain-containing protein [Acidobacteriota bacterium]
MRILNLIATGLLAAAVNAATLNYDFQLQTTEGYDVHGITMYATDGAGNDDIYFSPTVVPASGRFQLQHNVGFNAAAAMIVGYMQRNQDSKMDLVMWVSNDFASDVLGLRYSEVFPNGANGPDPGHNAWPSIIDAAASGDAASLGTLYDFFRRTHAYNPLFAPGGSYSIIEFSYVPPPIGGSVPEPSTMALVGAGALLVFVSRRRR